MNDFGLNFFSFLFCMDFIFSINMEVNSGYHTTILKQITLYQELIFRVKDG